MNSFKRWSKNMTGVLLSLLVMGCLPLQRVNANGLEKQLKEVHKKLTALKDNLAGLSKRLGELKIKLGAGELQLKIKELRSQAKKLRDEAQKFRNTANLLKAEGIDAASVEQDAIVSDSKAELLEQAAKNLEQQLLVIPPIAHPVVLPVQPVITVVRPPVVQQGDLKGVNAGLRNGNGNDCFFSAAFQVLSQIDPFVKALDEMDKKGQTTEIQNEFLTLIKNLRENPPATKSLKARMYNPATNATRDFRDFITQPFGDESYPQHIPSLFGDLSGLGPRKGPYSQATLTWEGGPADRNADGSIIGESGKDYGYNQEDAQEFFSEFFNMLTLRDKEDLAIRNLFTILEQNKKSKEEGGPWSNSGVAEPLKFLFLPVVSKFDEKATLNNLKACLDDYTAAEWIATMDMGKGETGGYRKPVFKAPLPKILMIIFKRFKKVGEPGQAGGVQGQKIFHAITFPAAKELDFAPYLEAVNQKAKYKLFGIVVHGGGTGGGHYRAYTVDRFDKDKKWREYNDSTYPAGRLLGPGEIEDIANQTKELGAPYMLFYEKVE